jgi:hypothetical protein
VRHSRKLHHFENVSRIKAAFIGFGCATGNQPKIQALTLAASDFDATQV